jgi:hypothetical protein
MRLRVTNPRDAGGAVLLFVVGGLLLIGQQSLPRGTAVNMGAGYVPNILGWGIMCIAVLLTVRSIRMEGTPLNAVPWRALMTILGSFFVFAILIERAGLALAAMATILLAAAATAGFRWKSNMLLAVALTAFSVVLFKLALGVAVSVWP